MARLEIMGPDDRDVVVLDGDKVVIGKNADCDIVIKDDSTVSRRHAKLERVGDSWAISDLSSTNGTTVNGERIISDRALRDGDEIMLGRTRLVYRLQAAVPETSTEAVASAPSVTKREKDVLRALCKPLMLPGPTFRSPGTVSEIAAALFVSESDVKGHLGRLYDKFQIEPGTDRRVRLANAAIQSGTIGFGDLH